MFRTRLLFFLIGGFAFHAPTLVEARWANLEEAPFVISRQNVSVDVRPDGGSTTTIENEFILKQERAREQLQVFTLVYDPGSETTVVQEAKVTNGNETRTVPRSMIEDSAVPSGREGMRNIRVISVRYPDLRVGSKVYVRFQQTEKKPTLPGYFYFSSVFGLTAPELGGTIEVRSKLPLFLGKNDPFQAFTIVQDKKGDTHHLKITYQTPIYRAVADEEAAVIDADSISRIEVSTYGTWQKLVTEYTRQMEPRFKERLPLEFEKILTAAGKGNSPEEKAEIAMAEVIKTIKYLGDWRTTEGKYYPRTLQKIAQLKLGDCKDYAFLTAVLLRKLGIPAWFALVHRDDGSRQEIWKKPLVPSLAHFNHAILRSEVAGRPVWLDPTNDVSLTRGVFNDIADRPVLAIRGQTTGLENTGPVTPDQSRLVLRKHMAFRLDDSADVLGIVEAYGHSASALKRVGLQAGKELLVQAALGLVNHGSPPEIFKAEPFEIDNRVSIPLKIELTYLDRGVLRRINDSPQEPARKLMIAEPPKSAALTENPKGRVSNYPIGGIGVYEQYKTFSRISLVFGAQSAFKSCEIKTRWMDISRKVETTDMAIRVHDRTEVKVSSLKPQDFLSEDYRKAGEEVRKCFYGATVQVQLNDQRAFFMTKFDSKGEDEALKIKVPPLPVKNPVTEEDREKNRQAMKQIHFQNTRLICDQDQPTLLEKIRRAYRRAWEPEGMEGCEFTYKVDPMARVRRMGGLKDDTAFRGRLKPWTHLPNSILDAKVDGMKFARRISILGAGAVPGDLLRARLYMDEYLNAHPMDPAALALQSRLTRTLACRDSPCDEGGLYVAQMFVFMADVADKRTTIDLAAEEALNLLHRGKEPQKKDEAVSRLKEWFPEAAGTHVVLGEIAVQERRFEEAIREFRTSLDSSNEPDQRAMSRLKLANAYAAAQKFSEAEKEYLELRKSNPEDRTSAIAYVAFLRDSKKYAESLKEIETLENKLDEASRPSLHPLKSDVYVGLARNKEKEKSFKEALELYQRAAQLNSMNADAYIGMGTLIAETSPNDPGALAFAQSQFARAAAIQPNHPDLKRAPAGVTGLRATSDK